MSDARSLLERLLHKAERARRRGAAGAVSLPMTSAASAADYLALRSLDERERFHAQIALAERDGAIEALRDRLHGDGTQLLRVTVRDLQALARHLGVQLLDARTETAALALHPWQARFPVLKRVLEAWRDDRKVRGRGPDAATELAAAAQLVAERLAEGVPESILRRESVRRFGDSKRIERLTPWLDLLVAAEAGDDAGASGLTREDVWAALGLRREPQPMLLSGNGRLSLSDGSVLPLPRPYLGVPAAALQHLQAPARVVLTIENLASFHDAASLARDPGLLIVYTGGMPSPAWRAAWRRLLEGLPDSVVLRHWGDIDAGGFRIAAVLAQCAREGGRELQPWRMSPHDLDPALRATLAAPSPATLALMTRAAEAAGWRGVAAALAEHPIQMEQERLDIVLP